MHLHMTRIQAFLIHLTISAAIILTLLALIFFIWYPQPLFAYEGASAPLTILVAVDMVLGPLLTLIIFKPGKKGLKFDLVLIATVQIVALLYGSWAIWSQRPAVIAFAADRFFIVSTSEINWEQVPENIRKNKTMAGPLTVYAEKIDDPDYTLSILLEGAKDIHQLPEQYRPVAEHKTEIIERSVDAELLLEKSEQVRAFFEKADKKLQNIDWNSFSLFPIHGRLKSGAALFNNKSGQIEHYLDFDVDKIYSSIKRKKREQKQQPSKAK